MVHDKIKALRERLERRKKATEAKARARERSRTRGAEARERAERERRLERGDPKGLKEEAIATVRAASSAKQAASGAVSAERQFLAQELGVSTDHAKEVAETGNSVLQSAQRAGVSLQQFDLDGDGDTDLLASLDQPAQRDRRGGQPVSIDPTQPVIDTPGRLEEPLFEEDVFEEPNLAEPSPGEIDMGL